MRGRTLLRRLRPPLTPTFSPQAGRGRGAHDALDGIDQPHVAGAAAEVAAHLCADLGAGDAALAAHQVAGGDQHAGRAVAALQRVRLAEGLAQAGHQGIVVEALDGAHAGAVAG